MRSALHLALLAIAAALSACAHAVPVPATIHKSRIAAGRTRRPSSKANAKPSASQPPYAARTATLEVTGGLKVAGVVSLPANFVPDLSRAPIWLEGGSEIGVLGTREGGGMMLGIGGARLSRQRIVIQDGGKGAAGRLLDIAASADGHRLAIAVAAASVHRLNVSLADPSNPGDAQLIASLKGKFDSAQLTWLTSGKVALAAHRAARQRHEVGNRVTTVPVGGLYLITEGVHSATQRLGGLACPLSALAFSPDDAVAVAQGSDGAPPAIIDLRNEKCVSYPSAAPLQVLGWAPNSRAFLYRTADQPGVFRFDLQTRQRSTIAISSGAAAYAGDGTIVAFGSQELSWRRAVAEPMTPVKAQIALFDPHQDLITINSLGFVTQPVLLAQSTMIWSQSSNSAIIDTAIPGPTELQRELINYSYPTREAFVLAHGPVRGPMAVSWSPDGNQVAILDGDQTHYTLSVITPPRSVSH
jgi:hypothetical protein